MKEHPIILNSLYYCGIIWLGGLLCHRNIRAVEKKPKKDTEPATRMRLGSGIENGIKGTETGNVLKGGSILTATKNISTRRTPNGKGINGGCSLLKSLWNMVVSVRAVVKGRYYFWKLTISTMMVQKSVSDLTKVFSHSISGSLSKVFLKIGIKYCVPIAIEVNIGVVEYVRTN